MAPVISHLLEQRQREKAISSLLEIFSLSITFNVDGMADDVIAPGIDTLTEETIDAVLPEFIDRLKSNRGYKLTRTTTGETLGYFSDQKREQFISEICDYVEFKLNKLIGEI